MMWKAFRLVLVSLGGLTSLLTTAWAAGALYFDLPIAWLRAPLASIYALAMLGALLFVKGRWRANALLLHRDAQEAWSNLLDYRRALPAVRAHLYRRR